MYTRTYAQNSVFPLLNPIVLSSSLKIIKSLEIKFREFLFDSEKGIIISTLNKAAQVMNASSF